jgi:hypothetical protein
MGMMTASPVINIFLSLLFKFCQTLHPTLSAGIDNRKPLAFQLEKKWAKYALAPRPALLSRSLPAVHVRVLILFRSLRKTHLGDHFLIDWSSIMA